MESTATQSHIIHRLGGPTRVAAMLSLEGEGAVQRVHNWIKRGVPPAIVLAHPKIFQGIKPEEIGGAERATHA